MYLDVAPKEESGVKDVADAGPPPPAGDFSRTEPPPHHPEKLQIRENRSQGSGIHALRRRRLQIWLRSNRGDPALQPPSTVPSPPARPRKTVSSIGERLPPPGSAPPSPDEAAAPSVEVLRHNSRAAKSLPPPSLAARAVQASTYTHRQRQK
jgi:hypothetical protein